MYHLMKCKQPMETFRPQKATTALESDSHICNNLWKVISTILGLNPWATRKMNKTLRVTDTQLSHQIIAYPSSRGPLQFQISFYFKIHIDK